MEKQTTGEKKKLSIREFFTLGEVGGYFFRKKDPSRPSNINIRNDAWHQQNFHCHFFSGRTIPHLKAFHLNVEQFRSYCLAKRGVTERVSVW
jgi:hypothetical protein